ncbi:hypothetical protein LPJ59_002855 [Coemansia sp. RSA 2399]|nr:hypothetical protein LPJ59_002855 [Coemansia sp. RSA 2399]KAJ1903759.1 hypothetical protein LPJ81_002889 [Coemansia sp. IMI 209127]
MVASSRRKVLFIVIAILVTSLLTLSASYYVVAKSYNKPKENQKPDSEKEIPLLPRVKELYSLKPVRKAPENITTTVFTFRGDFSSDIYDLFALQKRAVRYCDNDTTVDGCDVKLPRHYRWGTLSYKLLDALELMCNSTEKTDFYVKIDDDLIMSDSKLDEVIRVMAATNCQVSGSIARDYGFYWPVGQMYIFKRAILERICAKFPITRQLHGSEDISFGTFIDSRDKKMFCNLDNPTNHWHKDYKDQRVEIRYFTQHNV